MDDDGYSNKVTPVEQALLHQFKTQFNSWDMILLIQMKMVWDILASFYNMDINAPSFNIEKEPGFVWNGQTNGHTERFVQSSLKDDQSEGIPFRTGEVALEGSDFCNRTEEDYTFHSQGYYLRISNALASRNKNSNQNQNYNQNQNPHSNFQVSDDEIIAIDVGIAGGAIVAGAGAEGGAA
ncbi:hypothetical protein ACTFIY_012015 [Dictyostelium cf. discoideum]